MDPVAILRIGVSGLIFFLSLWSYRLISQEQSRSGSPRKGILRTIYVFLSANLLFALLVAVSGFFQSQSEQKATDVSIAKLEDASKKLDLAEAKNARYRELMAELAKTIDAKVEYEAQQEQGNVATLKPSVTALISTITKARAEGLVDQNPQ